MHFQVFFITSLNNFRVSCLSTCFFISHFHLLFCFNMHELANCKGDQCRPWVAKLSITSTYIKQAKTLKSFYCTVCVFRPSELTFCINVGNTFKDKVDFLSNLVHCSAQCHGEVFSRLRRLVGFPRCPYLDVKDAPSWSVGIDRFL